MAVAPENMRAAEPPDAEIPQLAETILAAGLLQPVTVRPGRRREKPGMVLDGRRRLLALQGLLADGRVGEDYPVDAFVETEPERRAAAVVLTNTAAPVHVADVIQAIGRMMKTKLEPAAIARALGYAEVEVRRLAALAGLHPRAIDGLRAGRITLRQARLLARLPNRKTQGEIAGAALEGYGFQEWRVADLLDGLGVAADDPRVALVGLARYAAAGGQVASDLFGERPDRLLDPELLHALWRERAAALAAGLAGEGLETRICDDAHDGPDAGLEPLGRRFGFDLDAEALAALRAAETAEHEAEAGMVDFDAADASADGVLVAYLRARLAAQQAAEPHRTACQVRLFPSRGRVLGLTAYAPPAPDAGADDDAAADAVESGEVMVAAEPSWRSLAPPTAVDTAGCGHALHALRTDLATRGLVRSLADHPEAALVALTARLLAAIVLEHRAGSALSVNATAYGWRGHAPIEALDGEVRRRLAARAADWRASGLSPIAWVAGLAADARLALLAELTALTLDLREDRTSSVDGAARAEAAEIGALCGADIRGHWTPDAAFFAAHAKGQLRDMLAQMGALGAAAAGERKDALAARAAREAAERGWAPDVLDWASRTTATAAAAGPSADEAAAAQAA